MSSTKLTETTFIQKYVSDLTKPWNQIVPDLIKVLKNPDIKKEDREGLLNEMWRHNPEMFNSVLGYTTFINKYAHEGCYTWKDLCTTLVNEVVKDRIDTEDKDDLIKFMVEGKFFPGGRYLYYAGREVKFYNNCYLLRAEEDTREDWANLSWKAESCLITGGGIGIDYSVYRDSKQTIKRTGGRSSGPIPKMLMVDSIGHNVMQGGSRRSAIYASLNWKHGDIKEFLKCKNWYDMGIAGTGKTVGEIRELDYNFKAPLDHTNISVNYDTEWLENYYKTGDYGEVFLENCKQALKTGEPGFSFNFFDKEKETLRNACTEVTSEDDSDVCNLGSINMARVDDISEFCHLVELATIFLLCGTLEADLPYDRVKEVRQKNRRLGLGLMGMHEWLLKRGYKYEVVPELHKWLDCYRGISIEAARRGADTLGISRPVACRAIAPTGSIAMLAGTTSGIEPLFAVAYKRRYLVGTVWKYQYEVEAIARDLIDRYGLHPDTIETAYSISEDFERRIKFQADVQDYVDMSISSTINLPPFEEQKFTTKEFADVLAKYAPRLRGFTCYPDGSRGGQPLTTVSYEEAVSQLGEEFEEHVTFNDVCSITERGGSCGV